MFASTHLGVVVAAVFAIAADAVLVADDLPELGAHLIAALAGCNRGKNKGNQLAG